jgi:cytochrome c peroxidase
VTTWAWRVGVALGALLALLTACGPSESAPRASLAPPRTSSELREPLQPLPTVGPLDRRKLRLGAKLFSDSRLSADHSVSCASCHDFSRGGADGQAHSVGVGGQLTAVNSPSIFNTAFNPTQLWNGRAHSIEEVVDVATQSPVIMGSSWPLIIQQIESDPAYVAAFGELYPERISPVTVRDALATYVRSLTTPNAPFDRFLQGDPEALDASEQEGYRLFKAYGCSSCHQGAMVGGNLYQKLGVMRDFFGERPTLTEADLGRYAITGDEQDRNVFRVPSLRNVALTAPYFHDGSARTLETAVGVMGSYQLGRRLSADDVRHIVRFLNTLTGEPPEVSP